MNNKIFDAIFFVGGTAMALLGLFGTIRYGELFRQEATDWYDYLFIIVGISMIVFGFVRRSWDKKENQ